MVEVLVTLHKVTDLSDRVMQRRYGVGPEILRGDDYGPCQRLARELRAESVEGLFTFSRADQPDGRQLVVFLDLLKPESSVKVDSVREVRFGKTF